MLILVLFYLSMNVFADHRFKFVKEGQKINLNDDYDCSPNEWSYYFTESKMPIVANSESPGIYHCSLKTLVLLTVMEKDIKFDVAHSGMPIYGENITLICSLSAWCGSGSLNKLRITNLTSVLYEHEAKFVDDDKYSPYTELQMTVVEGEDMEFMCSWDIQYSFGPAHFTHTTASNVSVKVYMPVRNVKPSATFECINGSISCIAEGQPQPQYTWFCHTVNVTNNITIHYQHLNMTEAGNYSCTCLATNIISDKIFNSTWEGIISFREDETCAEVDKVHTEMNTPVNKADKEVETGIIVYKDEKCCMGRQIRCSTLLALLVPLLLTLRVY